MSPTHQDLSNDTTFRQIKSRVPVPLRDGGGGGLRCLLYIFLFSGSQQGFTAIFLENGGQIRKNHGQYYFTQIYSLLWRLFQILKTKWCAFVTTSKKMLSLSLYQPIFNQKSSTACFEQIRPHKSVSWPHIFHQPTIFFYGLKFWVI